MNVILASYEPKTLFIVRIFKVKTSFLCLHPKIYFLFKEKQDRPNLKFLVRNEDVCGPSNILIKIIATAVLNHLLNLLLDDSQSTSPEDGATGASPRINRFLAREPPDGCEKVSTTNICLFEICYQIERGVTD